MRIPSLLLVVLLSLWTAPSVLAADARQPLLQPGKKTLFQRVLTHPGAALLTAPDAGAKAVGPIRTFSALYVYARKDGFMEVGPSSTGPSGWIAESLATEWPQAMTLLFTDRAGRMPVLFFSDEGRLRELCAAADLKDRLKTMEAQVQKARTGGGAADLPAIASEPPDSEGAVSRQRFYLMPIKRMSDPFEGTKFLEVASIDPGSAAAGGKGGPADGGQGGDGDKPRAMRTAIAFVIDTTISMKPYIDQSLQVVRAAFDDIEKNKLGDSVAFAIVAFRSSTARNPKVGYTTLRVKDFTTLKDRAALEEALAGVEEATASTHSFNEDSLAGIKAAVDELSWQDYQSRIMTLITDAGPLRPGDPLAGTAMGPTEMLDYAKSKNIWVTVAHVRSPAGARDHAYAEKAYRDLTRSGTGESSYIPLPAPNPEEGARSFARTAGQLAASLTRVAGATAARRTPEPPRAAAKPATPEERARRIGESIGYAMRLEFLGRQRDNKAPSVVNAWIADMDLALLADDRFVPAVDVAVLLSKNQLSDLQRTLRIVVDEAERTKKTDSKDFFQRILSASAQLARDPSAFSAQPGRNLQETGVLGEFLEGLPYKSDIMLLREDDWYRMSIGEQTAFINRLKSRIARYEEYDKDRSNWESFGTADAGDWLYRVPLSVLP